ncbi:MAG TPA: hypothetical protein DCZ91_19640 [Lachnospiraceae bacterium]|nr:hypothetical protein [Lachnospiraceae bacterium]
MYLLESKEKKLSDITKEVCAILMQSGIEEEKAVMATESMMTGNGFGITPPFVEVELHYISLSGIDKGASVKPGNIILNANKFIYELPSLIIMASDLQENEWLFKLLAFIVLWQQLLKLSHISFNKDEAVLLNALWHNATDNNIIDLEKGFQAVNDWRRRLSLLELNWDNYIRQIENLEKGRHLKSIDTFILLCEEIAVNYE